MPASAPDRLAGPMRQDLTTAHDVATQSLASPSAERPRLTPGDGGDGTPLVAVFGVVALSGALAALVIVRRRLV